MSDLAHPEPCQLCDEYYEYTDGMCWQCWHEAQELLRRENAKAEGEFKAEAAAADQPEEFDRA